MSNRQNLCTLPFRAHKHCKTSGRWRAGPRLCYPANVIISPLTKQLHTNPYEQNLKCLVSGYAKTKVVKEKYVEHHLCLFTYCFQLPEPAYMISYLLKMFKKSQIYECIYLSICQAIKIVNSYQYFFFIFKITNYVSFTKKIFVFRHIFYF